MHPFKHLQATTKFASTVPTAKEHKIKNTDLKDYNLLQKLPKLHLISLGIYIYIKKTKKKNPPATAN